MLEIEEILTSIKDESLSQAKSELLDYFNQAKDEQNEFVQETLDKTKEWLLMRLSNQIDNDEFNYLLETRKRTMKQNLNTLEIKTRAKLENLLLGIIDVIANKILTKLL